MKRYILFVMNEYDSGGGWNDVVDAYDSLGEAVASAHEEMRRHLKEDPVNGIDWQIVDTSHTGPLRSAVVAKGDSDEDIFDQDVS